MKKILLLTLSLITSFTLFGQYPVTGNKMRLGFQTTGDGLVYRGTVSDTSTLDPSSINNAWMLLDTTNGAVFVYRSKAWRSITMPYDSVTFNINNGDASSRELKYSDERGQLQYGGLDSVQIPLLPGIWYVRNDTSITIPKGTVVRASGTLGASGRIKVKHMIANGSMPARYILGVTMHDIAVGADGYIMFDGKIRNINTNGYSDADVLFADPQNPGGLRTKEPTGDSLKLPIVFVIHAASNGVIAVRITTGSYLHESHDVDTTGRVDGSVLRYDGTARYWKASTSAGIMAADTASMLTNYINVVDTSSMLSPYLKKADTTSLSNRINLKLNISDTSSMLTNYINVVDTTSMLLPYLRKSQMRGTATYIPKYATDSTLTNSIIRESNSKIGIGTSASSSYTINVANSDTGPGIAGGMYIGLTSAKTIANKGIVVDASGSANNYTGIETSATGGVLNSIALKATANGFGGGTTAIAGQFSATNATNNYAIEISSGTATDSLSYAIYSGSTAKTYLNGKLGLGTATPDSLLTVNGGGRFTNLVTAGGFRVTSSTSPVNGIFLPSSNRVGISTNNTEKVRIDSTGNVGIGTTSPTAYRLHVTQATNVGLYLNATGSGTLAPPTTYAPGAGGLLFAYASQAGDSFRRFLDIVADGSGGSAGSVIRFFTGNAATEERLRITQDGNVGIGTSTPASRLTVNGSTEINGNLTFTGANRYILATTGSFSILKDTASFMYTSAGGPWSSNPFWRGFHFGTSQAPITQSGAFTYPRVSHYTGYSTTTDPTDMTYVIETGNHGTLPYHITIVAQQNSQINLATNNTVRLKVMGDGKIGIGTTTPDSLLTVNGGFRTVNDANINGVRVGRGLGNISTNTVVGSSALNSNTTGLGNTALGIRALRDNTTGVYNIGIGLDAGESITTGNRNSFLGAFSGGTTATSMTGNENTGIGYSALYANTTGTDNVAVGAYSLDANTTGGINTAVGNYSLSSNTAGQYNVGVGYGSLFLNTTGTKNIGIGYNSLRSNTTASNNVAIGDAAGYTNQTGTANTLVGTNAGYNNTGTGNSFFGLNAGIANTTGGYNAFFGSGAGGQTTTGGYNVAIGGGASAGTTASNNTSVGGLAMYFGTSTGGENVAVGYASLGPNTTGVYNVGVGSFSLRDNTTGSDNTAIGRGAMTNNISGTGNTAVGRGALTAPTTANWNTAVGLVALASATGSENVAVGASALEQTTSGTYNVGIGNGAGRYNITGTGGTFVGYAAGWNNTASNNVMIGREAGYTNTSGTSNTFVGYLAGNKNTTASNNTFIGREAGYSNTTASGNVFVGYLSGNFNTGALNTFLGYESGYANTTSTSNTFVGYQSGRANTTNGANTFVGYRAGLNNTAGLNTFVGHDAGATNTSGTYNVFMGVNAGLNNTTGYTNTFIGYENGRSNATGFANTFLGSAAGYSNTSSYNTYIGTNAGYLNTTGTYNVALGVNALYTASTANFNTAIGMDAGRVTTGNGNTFVGGGAGYTNSSGLGNVSVGFYALYSNTTANLNTAVGYGAGQNNTVGTLNSFFGHAAGEQNSTAGSNTFLGVEAGRATTTGGSNVYIGRSSGQGNTTGIINVGIGLDAGRYTNSGADNQTTNYSVYLGAGARSSASGNSNEIVLGYDARGQGSNSIMLGNSSIANLYCYDTSISSPSDERDKKNVETLEIGLDFILGLRPVAFDWNMRDGGKKDIPDVGFIAQEVEPLQNILPQGDNLNVVHYQAQDDRYFMQSANLIPVLVKAIQEQQSQIQTLKQEIEILKSQINK